MLCITAINHSLLSRVSTRLSNPFRSGLSWPSGVFAPVISHQALAVATSILRNRMPISVIS